MNKKQLINAIIERTFVACHDWSPPEVGKLIGPSYPQAFEEFRLVTQRAFERVNKFLETQTLEELRAALKYTAERSSAIPWLPHPSYIEMFDAAIRLVPPPWYAGGFAVEGHEADFSYWARMNSWSWDEATALSIGFEPCEPIDGLTGEPPANPKVLEFYRKRRQQIGNKFFEPSSERTMHMPSPLEVAKWAAEVRKRGFGPSSCWDASRWIVATA